MPEHIGIVLQNHRLSLWGSLLVAFLPNGSLSAARYVLPTIAISVGAGAVLTGLLGAAFTALAFFLCHSFGAWVDRRGARLPFVLAMVLMTLGPLLYVLTPLPVVLVATAMFVGTGAMFGHITSAKAIGDLAPGAKRARNLGLMVLVYSFSQFLFPVIGGWSFEHFGTHAGLAVIVLPPLLALAYLPVGPNNYMPRAVASQSTRSDAFGVRALWRLSPLRIWIMSSSGFVAVQSIYPFLIALHASHIGLSPAEGGLALGAYALGTLASRASAPFVLKVASAPTLIIGALLLGALEYAYVPLTAGFFDLCVVSACIGATIGIGVPLTLALVYDAAPDGAQNAAVGLNTAMGNGLQTVLPLIFSISAATTGGVGPMVWVMSVTMVALAATILRRKD